MSGGYEMEYSHGTQGYRTTYGHNLATGAAEKAADIYGALCGVDYPDTDDRDVDMLADLIVDLADAFGDAWQLALERAEPIAFARGVDVLRAPVILQFPELGPDFRNV
jgi:hypothetical protein